MYIPRKFALSDQDAQAAVADGGFVQLVTDTSTGLLVTPLPMLYDGRSLVGHVSRANPHWHATDCESVAIFAGPQAYISPGFYATKAETGKVVPTWNYDVVAVYGRLLTHDDPDWVLDLVTRLTVTMKPLAVSPGASPTRPRPSPNCNCGRSSVSSSSSTESKARRRCRRTNPNATATAWSPASASRRCRWIASSPIASSAWDGIRHHERERAWVAQPGEARAAHIVDAHRPNISGRRLITLQPVRGGLDDQHPMPRDVPAEEHRHRPTLVHCRHDVGHGVATPPEQAPPIRDAHPRPLLGQRASHATRRGAELAWPDAVHLRMHATLLGGEPRGPGDRLAQRCAACGIEQRSSHHGDRRAARHAVALTQPQTGELHRIQCGPFEVPCTDSCQLATIFCQRN